MILFRPVVKLSDNRIIDLVVEVDVVEDGVARVTVYRSDIDRMEAFTDRAVGDEALSFASKVEALYYSRDGVLSFYDRAFIMEGDAIKDLVKLVLDKAADRLGIRGYKLVVVESMKLISKNIPPILIVRSRPVPMGPSISKVIT